MLVSINNSVPTPFNASNYYVSEGSLIINNQEGLDGLVIMFSVLVTSVSPYYYVETSGPSTGKVVSGYFNTTFNSFAEVTFLQDIAPVFSTQLNNVTLNVSQ